MKIIRNLWYVDSRSWLCKMFSNLINSIKKFNENHPYLSTILIFLVASSIGITVQYLIDGRIIKAGFYPAASVALAGLFSVWLQKRKKR